MQMHTAHVFVGLLQSTTFQLVAFFLGWNWKSTAEIPYSAKWWRGKSSLNESTLEFGGEKIAKLRNK